MWARVGLSQPWSSRGRSARGEGRKVQAQQMLRYGHARETTSLISRVCMEIQQRQIQEVGECKQKPLNWDWDAGHTWQYVHPTKCTESIHKTVKSGFRPTSYLMPFSLSQVSTLRQKGEMLGTVGVLENCRNGTVNAIPICGILQYVVNLANGELEG